LTTWVRSISHIRNICAHHSRLWNRSPTDQPKPPMAGEIPLLDYLAADHLPLWS
jgi:abortive infection bacteriophage resistance protein